MKELQTNEIEKVVGAGGLITDLVGGLLGDVNKVLGYTVGNGVSTAVQNTEIGVANLLNSLVSFKS